MKIFSISSSTNLPPLSATALNAGLLLLLLLLQQQRVAGDPLSSTTTTTTTTTTTDDVVVTCSDPDESVLLVRVKTDFFSVIENSWVLELKQQEEDDWIEVATKSFELLNTLYEDALCLQPDSTYRWTIFDTWGDGLSYTSVPVELLVNDETIYEEEGEEGWFSLEVQFLTPSDPDSGPAMILTDSPSESPSALQCTDDEDLLNIDVNTDSFAWENSWVLDEKDPITSDYFQIASSVLQWADTLYQDKFCLDPNVSYRWTLTDDRGIGNPGNGFNCINDNNRDCGYSVKLNGGEIVSNGRMFDEVVKEIGPVDCSEDVPGVHRVVNPKPGRNTFKSVHCNRLRNLIKDTGSNEGCFAKLIDGSGYLYDKCKKMCGRAGAGPCA